MCRFILEAHLLDCAYAPALKMTIMLNSKLTQRSWRLVDWELWGRSAAELNAAKLHVLVKFIHKEWPTGHRLHRYHKTDPVCPHFGEYEDIKHVFTLPSLAAVQDEQQLWQSCQATSTERRRARNGQRSTNSSYYV